nr:hypothetical protein [Tanacetum cinerariifolium]
MTSLADKAILSGADNRPPMLEKDMYDSWKSQMELYMLNRQHGRMILKSFENGPLLWPTVEENGVTRTMDITIEQQSAMDEALVTYDQRLRIGRSNFRLLSDIKSKESTLQLVYDVLRICPFFKAFLVEHKNTKKSNEMYYPRFTKFSAMLPIELTNKEIRNSNAYKEYYAVATGAAPPKPKASVRRTRSSSDTSITPPTAAASPRLIASVKGKQTPKASKAKSLSSLSEVAMTKAQQLKLVTKKSMQQTHISQARGSGADEGTSSKPWVLDAPTDESEEELSWNSTDDEGADDEGKDGDDDDDQEVGRDDDKDNDEEGGNEDQEYDEEEYAEETRDEESFDPIPRTSKNSDDEGNGDEDLGLNIGGEEGHVKEEEEYELYRDVNINQGRGIKATLEVKDSHVTLTPVNPDGQQQSSSVSSQFVTSMLNPTLDVGMKSIFETTLPLDVQTPTSVAPLSMSAPTMTPSTIAIITTTSQAPILPTTVPSTIIQNLPNFGSLFRFDERLRSLKANFSEAMQTNQFAGAFDRLRNEAQRENDEFLKTVYENMKKIIKEQVKDQVKVQVSKILPRIEQAVNEQLEAEVLTRSSHSLKTSYAVAIDLSEMELKKILIEKMEGNKSIQRSDEQRNLYKALVKAYESDKIILDAYGETVTLKRRRDDDVDKDKEPSAGPDRGSKRRKKGKEPESASAPSKTATRIADRSTKGSRSQHASASESVLAEEPVQTTFQIEEPSHLEFDTGAEDHPIVQSSQHLELFSQQQKPPSLDRDWNKTVPAVHGSIQPWISELVKQVDTRSSFNELVDTPLDFSNFLINRLKVDTLTPELLADPTYELMKGSCKSLVKLEYHLEEVFKATTDQLDWVNPKGTSSCKYTTSITKTKATDYGHIKWIEDLVPRTMWIKEPIGYDKHALWGRKEAYTAYSNPRGFIYQNKDKRNRLMWIDELHKFSDGALTDVRTALDDSLKGIRMQYLPQSIWRKSDKDRAAAMIQAIDKRLKTKRIMRSLERFVRGRLYERDFRMLQRTI